MQYYRVNVYSSFGTHLYDSYVAKDKSAAAAQKRAIQRIEAHLDEYGDETCDDGLYPSRYTVEVRQISYDQLLSEV